MCGCSPKKAEQGDSASGPVPTATPSTEPFRILLELSEPDGAAFKTTVDREIEIPGGWHLEWKSFDSYTGRWDMAFVTPFSIRKLSESAMDLRDLLDRVFPLHKADFIVSASQFQEEGRLMGVPVLFVPHFLYAKSAELSTSIGLTSYLAAGKKIALPDGEAGEWYGTHLSIDPNQVVPVASTAVENPYLNGSVDVAIADRSWIAAHRIPQDQIYSLSGLESLSRIPDWGIRIAISNQCANPSLAHTILKSAIVDLQDKLVGAGGGAFPVRRSVYQSPRVQGALLGAPKKVFDTTLERLGTPN